jgi:dipeptidyl aminopeptidase/acylaminoacyl peptidase
LKTKIHRLFIVILLSSTIFIAALTLFLMLPPGVSTHLRLYEEVLGNGRILICGQNTTIYHALVVIHGGRASSQAAVEYCKSFYDKLGDLGFLVFSIDYPENMTLMDEINYVVKAIEYIKMKYFINYEKMCIIGTSRGGYLALMAGIKTGLECIVDAYGPTDLEETFNHARRDPALWSEWGGYYTSIIKYIEDNKLNKTLVLQDLSPIYNVAKIHGRILLMHGLRDETIPPTHTVMLAEALEKEGKTNYVIKLYEEERHGFSLLKGKPYEDLRKFLQEFLEKS